MTETFDACLRNSDGSSFGGECRANRKAELGSVEAHAVCLVEVSASVFLKDIEALFADSDDCS